MSNAKLGAFPASSRLITQVYDNDTVTDHRMAEDIFNNVNIATAEKDFSADLFGRVERLSIRRQSLHSEQAYSDHSVGARRLRLLRDLSAAGRAGRLHLEQRRRGEDCVTGKRRHRANVHGPVPGRRRSPPDVRQRHAADHSTVVVLFFAVYGSAQSPPLRSARSDTNLPCDQLSFFFTRKYR